MCQMSGAGGIHLRIDFDQELDMSSSDDDRVKDLDEQSYLTGYNLDADRLVCNELSLNLPMKVLCKEDCKGICNSVEQISIMGFAAAIPGHLIHGWQLSRIFLNSLRRCNHVYLSKEQIF